MTRTICLLLTAMAVSACRDSAPPSREPTLAFDALLAPGEVGGFAVADEPGTIELPRDHGAHPRFRSEWWYVTGNLEDEAGARYGYQFTIFRLATAPKRKPHPSGWATNQVYLAHAALSLPSKGRYLQDQRVSRGALQLAGVTTSPFAAWVEQWRLGGDAECAACEEFDLAVSADGFSLRLHLANDAAAVMHGQEGLSYKNRERTSASYYYSLTRLDSSGEIEAGNDRMRVSGESWFDHEWSTSTLGREQSGWDWFSLQLSDDSELMLFEVRHHSDPSLHYRSGTLVAADGTAQRLQTDQFAIDVTDHWRSPRTGVRYPGAWQITLPGHAGRLAITPLLAHQEVDLALRYWEGAVVALGTLQGRPVTGRGYAELTGYGNGTANPDRGEAP